jgi:hypothetical protein
MVYHGLLETIARRQVLPTLEVALEAFARGAGRGVAR